MLDGFTVESFLHKVLPIEDAYRFSAGKRNIIVTADGITRDPHGLKELDLSNAIVKARFVLGYPKPSPAKQIADSFSDYFCVTAEAYDEQITPVKLGYLMRASNHWLKHLAEEYKRRHNIEDFDYLIHDIPGCVASCAVEEEGKVIWGFIADCGVTIFEEDGKLLFRTPNEGPNSRGSIDQDVLTKYKTAFRYPQGRKIIRREYRNNPSNPLSYGAFTGEVNAGSYIRTGERAIFPGQTLMAYTDGLEDAVYSEEFSRLLKERRFDQLKPFCKSQIRTEGSLVYLAKR
jgi:hypothetical protein